MPMLSPRRLLPSIATLALVAVAACGGSSGNTSRTPAPRPTDPNANTVGGEDLRTGQVQSIEEYLSGRVPGLSVMRTESGQYSIRIRGNASADGEPLLVVDGVAVPQGMNSDALRSLNPREIAKVDVLKDASATAMYGSRGANGVLVIKTRHR